MIRYIGGSAGLAALLLLSLHSGPIAAQETDQPPNNEVLEEVRVFGERIAEDPPFGFSLNAETLDGMPGTQDDPIKAVVTLPGVLTNSDFDTGVALRGTRPSDNRYYLDFLPTGYLFHLTGKSVVDGDTVAQLQLLSAGFGVTYQGVIGGIISAKTRDPASREMAGIVDISLIDAGLMVEGPVTDRQRAVASVRVSYYDLVIGDLVEEKREEDEQGLDIVQLPKYTDYRARYQIDIGARGKLDFLVDGATDEVQFNLTDEDPFAVLDPARAGSYRFDIAYNRQGLIYSQPYDNGLLRLGFGLVQTDISGQFGDTGQTENQTDETVFRVLNQTTYLNHNFNFGFSVSVIDLERDLVIRDNGCTEFDVDCLFSDEEFETSRLGTKYVQGNIFIEDQFALTNALDLTVGLGYTAEDYLNHSALEPRARLDWSATDFLTISAGLGRYSQLPSFDYTDPTLGNPRLTNLRADHYLLGVNAIVGRGYLGSFNVFYKDLDDLVTSDPLTRYDNDGEGRAWGAEIMLRKGIGKLNGWFSATWSRSFRTDSLTGQTSRFEFDQPLSASIVAKYDLTDTIAVSGRVAYHSGAPVTPILDAQPDPARPNGFLPEYGQLNSDRLPAYLRTDLRLDWKTGWHDTTVYFEIINATNHENVAGYEYNVDYSERKNIEQLPRFISVGAKKRW